MLAGGAALAFAKLREAEKPVVHEVMGDIAEPITEPVMGGITTPPPEPAPPAPLEVKMGKLAK